MVKKKRSNDFPHNVMRMLLFHEPLEDLETNMASPFRSVSKMIASVVGDSMYAVAQSKGDPKRLLAGQLQVAIDNLDIGPQILKTTIMGQMQTAINRIVSSMPPEKTISKKRIVEKSE